jgi:DNA polymerase III, delta subunit
MKVLNNDLKTSTFKGIYVLSGDDEFLKNSYKKRLKSAIVGEDEMNFAYFEGKGIDADTVIEFANTLPFFSEYRCILIEESLWFKSGNEKFLNYISTKPDSTKIIFVEKDLDKRSKLYKKVKELGYIAELNHPTNDELMNWTGNIINKSGKNITVSNMNLFIARVGNDMERLKSELDKLLSFTLDKDIIEEEDIVAVTSISLTNRIFELVKSITNNKIQDALDIYEDLVALKEPPIKIMILITRQFNQLLQIKELATAGFSEKDIISSMKLNPYVVKNLMRRARGFDMAMLLSYVKNAIELEEAIKQGNINDKLALEMLMLTR